mgnify:FL=1
MNKITIFFYHVNQEGQYERIFLFYRGDFYLQGVYKEK